MKGRLISLFVLMGVFAVGAVFADDYSLSAGESDSISTNVTFDTMTVNGALTLPDVDCWINAWRLNMTGGTILIDGKKATIGCGHYAKTATVVTNAYDENGVYGKVTVQNGTYGIIDGLRRNFASRSYIIVTNDSPMAGRDGYVDIFDMRGGGVEMCYAYNYSSLTGRVTVTGANVWGKIGGYDENSMFKKGAFLFDLADGSTMRFSYQNQRSSFNDAGVTVLVQGTGNMVLESCYNSIDCCIRKGAWLNASGTLTLTHEYGNSVFNFATGTIGPDVKEIILDKYVFFKVDATESVSVGDVNGTAESAFFVGNGEIVVDASRQSRAFRGCLPPKYQFLSGAAVYDNNLTLAKVGSYEATVAATNLPNVSVREGDLRLVTDCTVNGRIEIADGARLVVDGHELRLADGASVRGSAIVCVNGGRIVKVGSGQASAYELTSLDGPLHVAEGSLVFTRYGLPYRRWRLVLKKYSQPATAASWFSLNRLWLFGSDGSHVGLNLGYLAQDAEIAEGKVKFTSQQTLQTKAGAASWCSIARLDKLFAKEENANSNNLPNLEGLANDIDPEDPDTWVAVEWWLKSTDADVVSYNMCRNVGGTYPTQWTLQALVDGEWVDIDDRRDVTPFSASGDTYYDGTSYKKAPIPHFILSGYRRDGLAALAEPLAVQVDAGSTLDLRAFTGQAQTVNRLTVDCALEGGTIRGGALADSGVVDFVNVPPEGFESVAFAFEETQDLANLANWTVTLDGMEFSGVAAAYDTEAKALSIDAAFVHVTESGEGDLQTAHPDKNLVVIVDPDVAFTNTVALAGSRTLGKLGAGTLVLIGAADGYSGTIDVSAGVLEGVVSNAFGTGTVMVRGSTTSTCQVRLGSKEVPTAFANDFEFVGDSSAGHPALAFETSNRALNVRLQGEVRALGYLAIADSGNGSAQGYSIVYFEGDVTAPGATISYPCDNDVHFLGRLQTEVLHAVTSYPRMGCFVLHSSANEIGSIQLDYIRCRAETSGAFGGAELKGLGSNTEAGRGSFDLYGTDQTAVCLSWEQAATRTKDVKNQRYDEPASLTLTGGVAYAKSCHRLIGGSNVKNRRIDFVIAAGNDDFVQELTNSVSTTEGAVIVSNGTLRLTGESSLALIPSLAVERGAFELDGTLANALTNVTQLSVGAGGRLRLGAEAATPFGEQPKAELRMESDASLELPEGAAVTVKKAWVGGMPLVPGTYTGAEGSVGEKISQIVGKGTLTVLRGGGMVLFFR